MVDEERAENEDPQNCRGTKQRAEDVGHAYQGNQGKLAPVEGGLCENRERELRSKG